MVPRPRWSGVRYRRYEHAPEFTPKVIGETGAYWNTFYSISSRQPGGANRLSREQTGITGSSESTATVGRLPSNVQSMRKNQPSLVGQDLRFARTVATLGRRVHDEAD